MENHDEISQEEEEFIPRNYQTQLMKIAQKENTIIFLPTGAGKTYIALMVLKQMSGELQRAYNEGGKLSILLVNTVALVNQHTEYLERHVPFKIGAFSGEKKVDFYEKRDWLNIFNQHQILIMTSQIFLNIVNSNFIDMNKVNLIIFDECHRGVNDHSMRNIMMNFENINEPPRVIGLTATLLNGNCKLYKVMDEVRNLETTFHSKVATVDELEHVVGFSTNPTENIKVSKVHSPHPTEKRVIEYLSKLCKMLRAEINFCKVAPLKSEDLQPLEPVDSLSQIRNIIQDAIIHIQMLGLFGGRIAILAHMIQIERIKLYSQDRKILNILNGIVTSFTFVKSLFDQEMRNTDKKERIYKYSSDKVKVLFEIIKEFKTRSSEELSAIVFVQRRFTAKVIHFILEELKRCDDSYNYINSNFMVGFNTKPFNDTREGLYNVKQNFKVLEKFRSKELNLLVASNVLEEGIDMPRCTLVVKFDLPNDYRSYVQSKGRARHKNSFFYIIVDNNEYGNFMSKYDTFQKVENVLNNFLIGKNELRTQPSKSDIQKMYNENEFPPYFVNGPGSAQVNMLSAIPLLCQYCSTLSADKYTVHYPEWYIENSADKPGFCRVVIFLPVISQILEPIRGPFCLSSKIAKRAAALEACIILHKIGELDDHLKPKMMDVLDEDTEFLFEHWPSHTDKEAGMKKRKRIYPRKVPTFVKGQINSNQTLYLHVIDLDPQFKMNHLNNADALLEDLYKSPLCYGFITPKPLPTLCKFPVYVTQGEIAVNIKINQNTISLSSEQIHAIRGFHHLVFNDVLKLLQRFLIFNNSEDAEMTLIVPVCKESCQVDFATIQAHKVLKNSKTGLTHDERVNLVVKDEDYVGKIVVPWYRQDDTHYIVVDVCNDLNANSKFPSNDFSTFLLYYSEKYQLTTLNPSQPLLLVKALSRKLVCIRPRGSDSKRKKEALYDGMEEHLIAEFCVKQDFPACLWLQATLLPTILYHLKNFLHAEELRKKISNDILLGDNEEKWHPLELDIYASNNKPNDLKNKIQYKKAKDQDDTNEEEFMSAETFNKLNQDLVVKMLESKFPWKDIDEPKDIERDLYVNATEIYVYEKFINNKVDSSPEKVVAKPSVPAITYDKRYKYNPILLIKNDQIERGPQLCEIYKALTTVKANNIVNLERLETLGDSFLKLASTLYIYFKYPDYNEGKATTLKNKLISNKNLFYLGVLKDIPSILQVSELAPKVEWLPPGFSVPDIISKRIQSSELSVNSLFNFVIPAEEQIKGILEQETEKTVLENCSVDVPEDTAVSLCNYLNQSEVSDKTVADSVEALLGVYFQSNGFTGGIKFIEWMGIVPRSENLLQLIRSVNVSPTLTSDVKQEQIDFHIPTWQTLETTLGYHFKNRAFLLQALTHSSYTPNRITKSYEILEFIGDALLDFLITTHIYETSVDLNPGQLTDLRSALVNNNTFASYSVRCGFHKYLLFINTKLEESIDNFVKFQEHRNHVIDDEVLVLLEENDVYLAEHVDVPKVLGDLFEALVGAVFLDCDKNLDTVWEVFHKIMWKEIDLFGKNVPKNVVRRLCEMPGVHPFFYKTKEVPNGKSMIKLEFMVNGSKTIVRGFGDNKIDAKRAAAKMALRVLQV